MKLIAYDTTGGTVYFIILDASGQARNGSAFEALNPANWTTYDIAATEGAGGVYLADCPALAAGAYNYVAYRQAGANPATSDVRVSTGSFVWDGSDEITLATIEAQTDDIGVAGAGLTALPQIPVAFFSEITAQYGVATTFIFVLMTKDGSTGIPGLTFTGSNSYAYLVTAGAAAQITTIAAHAVGGGMYVLSLSAAQMQFQRALFFANDTGGAGRPVYFVITTYGNANAAITDVPQAGDVYSQVGVAGAGLTAIPPMTLANGAHGGAAATITLATPVQADLQAILGEAITGTAAWIVAAWKKFFNIETPLLTTAAAMRGTDGAYTGTPDSAADIKTAMEADGSKLDHLWEMTEDDGGVRRLTANALEEAPASGTALTAQEVRDALKLAPSSGTAAAGSVDAQLSDGADKSDVSTLTTAISGSPAAVWGYTTRTLTSLSTLVASIAASVWVYATRTLTSTAAATTAAVTGSTLTLTSATTYEATLTGLTIPVTWTKAFLTFKKDKKYPDTQAVLQIAVSNPAAGTTDGALYVEGNAVTTLRTQASLAMNQVLGTADVVVEDDLMALITEHAGLYYDLKVLKSGTSRSTVLTSGKANVELTPTWAIS